MEVLVVLGQLVPVVLHDRDRIGAAEEELRHRVPVHRAEPGGELDLLVAVEPLLREDEHPVPVQGLPDRRRFGVVDRRELHALDPRPDASS